MVNYSLSRVPLINRLEPWLQTADDPWDDPSSAFGAKQRRSWHASCNMAIDVTLLIQLIRDEQPESYLKIFENSMNTLTT